MVCVVVSAALVTVTNSSVVVLVIVSVTVSMTLQRTFCGYFSLRLGCSRFSLGDCTRFRATLFEPGRDELIGMKPGIVGTVDVFVL